MVTIISAVILLGILIFVHELGHFLAAKAMGVKVERFSLGFPPKMIGKQIGETEYVLSWVPLGGYVKMFGENPDETDTVPPEEEHRSFSHKPAWSRFLIVFAGPAFNFLLAFVVFWVLFSVEGVERMTPVIGTAQEEMPAKAAGLQAEDRIVSIDGRPVKYWDDVLDIIQGHKGGVIEIVVDRGGQTVTAQVTPKTISTKNLFGETIQVPRIGIISKDERFFEKVGPLDALYYGAYKTYDITKLMIVSVVKMVQGKISRKNLGGPILIVQLAGERAKAGLAELIIFGAIISINLGILNLLPIPVLDGGHLAFFALEAIFRRPISIKIREKAQQAGVVFLILFMIFIFYNDLERIFTKPTAPPGTVQEEPK